MRRTHGASNNGRVVVSINDAVLCMRMATVRQPAMGFSLIDKYSQGLCRTFDYPGFIRLPPEQACRINVGSAGMARIRIENKAGRRFDSLLWLSKGG